MSGEPARAMARRAGVVVRDLRGLDELRQVDDLFTGIWGPTGAQVAMPANLLQALVHTGNFVAGAWRGNSLVAASVGFIGQRDSDLELHSHVTGVSRAEQGRGVGLALKLHQRGWALSHGIRRVTWTYDPLARRNAWFNLVKLQARAVDYFSNFYGIMIDELNGNDETDRCFVRWDLDVPWKRPTTTRAVPTDAGLALIASATHDPVVHPVKFEGDKAIVCQIPEDIVALRRRDPGLAREWRLALRSTMGAAMNSGYVATSITRDGWYLLERGA